MSPDDEKPEESVEEEDFASMFEASAKPTVFEEGQMPRELHGHGAGDAGPFEVSNCSSTQVMDQAVLKSGLATRGLPGPSEAFDRDVARFDDPAPDEVAVPQLGAEIPADMSEPSLSCGTSFALFVKPVF
jgi:hypothetical protein